MENAENEKNNTTLCLKRDLTASEEKNRQAPFIDILAQPKKHSGCRVQTIYM